MFVYVGVAATWLAYRIYPISGDEPHYLIIADSLLRRHDLRVIDDYFLDTPVHHAVGIDLSEPVHLSHVTGGYSIHGVGLPLLLLVPYSVAGPAGARLFMALAAGLIPLVAYRAARRMMASPRRSAWLAFTLAMGLPFAAAANQIFPDLPAGVLIIYIAGTIAAVFAGESDRLGRRWRTLLAIAFLPWLHMRLLAPAVILLFGYLYGLGITDRKRLVPLLLPLSGLAASFAALATYNLVAFGRATGPYDASALSFDPRQVSMILLGLHFDEAQGMFMQQPLLLLGLVGLSLLFRHDRRLGILLAAVYTSVVVPNAMHGNWYGGASLVGRFAWAAILLWVFPMASAIEAANKPDRTCLALFSTSIALQILLATRWLTADSLLIARGDLPWWAPTGVYGALLSPAVWIRLPSFKDFETYLQHPANWIALAVALLLTLTGWLLTRRSSRLVRIAWLTCVASAVTIVMTVPPPLAPWSIDGYRLPGLVGSVDGSARTAIERRDPEGDLTYGPYVPLAAGTYAATLRYDSDSADAVPAGHWEIVLGDYQVANVRIAEGDLFAPAVSGGTFRTDFVVPKTRRAKNVFQFRVRYPGSGRLSVQSLTLTPLVIGSGG